MSDSSIPYGYCHCGCGGKTNLSPQNHARSGYVKGQPFLYINQHGRRGRGIKSDIKAAYAVDDETGCWNWLRSVTTEGYGQVWVGNTNAPAHRYVYEKELGPIPAGLTLDHLCRNRACVNPAHLEPVTNAENIRRGIPYRTQKGRKRGHYKNSTIIIYRGESKTIPEWSEVLGVSSTLLQYRLKHWDIERAFSEPVGYPK